MTRNDPERLVSDNSIHIISLEKVHNIVTLILYAIPLQLLSCHAAIIKGTDTDHQPENLKKSVTVE